MTREEALKELYLAQADVWYRPTDDAIDMAIEALEQEPCDNAISHEIPYNAKGSSLYSEVYTEVYGDE